MDKSNPTDATLSSGSGSGNPSTPPPFGLWSSGFDLDFNYESNNTVVGPWSSAFDDFNDELLNTPTPTPLMLSPTPMVESWPSFDEETLRIASLSPLMFSPTQMVLPLPASSDVNVETLSAIPPSSMVTMGQTITTFTTSNEFNGQIQNTSTPTIQNTSTPTPVEITPTQEVGALTALDDVNNTTTPPPPMVSPTHQEAKPTEAYDDHVNHENHNVESPPTSLMVSPMQTITPSNEINGERYETATRTPSEVTPSDEVMMSDESKETTTSDEVMMSDETHATTPPPLMVSPLRVIPFVDSNNSNVADVVPSTLPVKRGRGRPKGSKNKNMSTKSNKKQKIYDPNSRVVESFPGYNSGISDEERETGNKEIVDLVLMKFDAVRRKFCQLGTRTLLTTASKNCQNLGVKTNEKKRVGEVPGIQVGDIFYFWGEMFLVGLHKQTIAGIDYLTSKDGALLIHGPVATSVVTSGHYDDETFEVDSLVYTGQGGKDKNKQPCDQKLIKGNRALQESHQKGNEVRVIRGLKDPHEANRKIYIYDGIYTVSEQWIAKGKTGFDTYKFRLLRKPGQPSAYATWITVEKWRKFGLDNSRDGIVIQDISAGVENSPVLVVNEVDVQDKEVPEHFDYTKSLVYSSMNLDLTTDRQSIGCKTCNRSCITEDANCACVRKNGGELPYHNRILVCHKPSIYECGQSCECLLDCNNRVVQMGLKLRVEVFKTDTCGWGLRAWEPIRAGTFICEFAGLHKTKEELEEDDEYVFDSSRTFNRANWNYDPELIAETVSEQAYPEVFNFPNKILISARRYGNVGRFMNHSCSPNVFWQPIEYELNGESYYRVGFFAMRHIPPMTELRYDYGVSLEEVGEDGARVFERKKVCLCGSDKCRGSFG